MFGSRLSKLLGPTNSYFQPAQLRSALQQSIVRTMASSPALAYIIVYVDDVEKSIAFYEKAFGLKTRMATGEKRTAWAEMETGSTTLAFTPKAQVNDKVAL